MEFENPEVLVEIEPGNPWVQDRDAGQYAKEELKKEILF